MNPQEENEAAQSAQRLPPFSREAEQSVLGALLLKNEAIDKITDLRTDHFYSLDHQLIFATMTRMFTAAKPVDVITVHDALIAAGKLEQAGGIVYLNQLMSTSSGAANIVRYAEIVRGRALRRGLISLSDEMAEACYTGAEDLEGVADTFAGRIEALVTKPTNTEPQIASAGLPVFLERLDAVYHGEADDRFVSTGLVDLDDRLDGGLARGDLVVIAARPSMGKTALALNIANHIATTEPVLVLSMEMRSTQLQARNIAQLGRLPLRHLINAKLLEEQDWPCITNAMQQIEALQLYIDDQPALRIMEARLKARSVKRRNGGRMGAVVVDYIGLMQGDGDGRTEMVTNITAGLKSLAKELDCPVIALSQLNRQVEQRPNKRPMMSDLRDSGSVEQDADTIIFLYRDEYYNQDSPDRGICEAIIGKQRQGEAGVTAKLAFIGAQVRFENLARTGSMAPRRAAAKQVEMSGA